MPSTGNMMNIIIPTKIFYTIREIGDISLLLDHLTLSSQEAMY